MKRAILSTIVLLCIAALPHISAVAADPVCAPEERQVSAGVHYEQLCQTSSEGNPWSIYVLRVSRKARVSVHAVAARNQSGEMIRELPTAMARRELDRGHRVLAVVNGDFDFTKPETMGVSLGLSVVEGRLWTGDQVSRPVLAFTNSGDPVIGVPAFRIEAKAGKKRIPITAFNKPITQGKSGSMFTGQFRSRIQLNSPAGWLIAERLETPLPLYKWLSTQFSDVRQSATEVAIPRDGIALMISSEKKSDPISVKPGDDVQLRIDARVEGKHVRDAIGGFPILVRGGKRSIEGEIGENLRKRHPRTAACYTRDYVIFTVVDGRQPSLSVGMTLEELSDLMIGLGCEVAMNTDGGGSSVMAVQSSESSELQIVNSPSDGKERGRGNAWVIEASIAP